MSKPFYITTPIYYPNSNLHLGHSYTTIVADVLKRIKQIQGYDAYLVTGTDEHGQKIQEAAAKAGLEPKEFVDKIVASAKDLWKTLDIKYDAYVRSTDPDHEKNVQAIFTKLYEQGDIYKDVYKGHYCTPCESFWTDSQLVDGKCPDCGREVEYHEEESYFFRLSKYQDRLLKLFEENPDFIKPEVRKNEIINNFFKEGLQDLSVSRSTFDWGVKVPFDEKHVIYVWIDALSCYLTGCGYGKDEEAFKNYWPASVHLVGKEIIRFHCIIWPALLMALNLPIPKQVFAHGWILFDNDKMSKSKGNVVYAEPIIERYGVDALKYFVLREFTFGQDGSFTNEKFLQRINSDLANDLGNLVSRTIQMVIKYNNGVVKAPNLKEDVDLDLAKCAKDSKEKADIEIEKLSFSTALEAIWTFIRRCNKYIDETTPWILGKEENHERLDTVLYNLIESIRIIGKLIEPFMPTTSQKIYSQLCQTPLTWDEAGEFGLFPIDTKIERGDNLFPRLDVEKEVEALTKANLELLNNRLKDQKAEASSKKETCSCNLDSENLVSLEDFEKLELKVCEVVDCKAHPNADKLLVFDLLIGKEKRTIVSGIRKHYKPEDLIGKKLIAISNLKPVTIRGIESKGMLLSAILDDKLSLLSVLNDIDSGAVVS